MECTLQQDTLQEKRKVLLINFQRLRIYIDFFKYYMIYQTAKILVITRQNINQARKPVLSEKKYPFIKKH